MADVIPSLDGIQCQAINSRLKPLPERPDPVMLAHQAGNSFLGSKIYGQGFLLTPAERDVLIANSKHNADRIYAYIGGEELNTHPKQAYSRYVIGFGQLGLKQVETWPELLALVRQKVKPERDRLREDTGPGKHGKKYWWQFQHPRQPLYEAISRLGVCLVNSQVSKHLIFARQPTDRIFAHTLYVYPLDRHTAFAVLQSRIHEHWARLLSSSMKTDLRYAASDCFDTFPFPHPDPRTVLPELEAVGEQLYEARASYMVDTDQGLTKTYNALKDPEVTEPRILELRRLHEEMDRAVLAAYSWPDIPVPPYCPKTEADQQALRTFEDEVIDRLFVLNAERAEQEEIQGLRSKKGKQAKKKPKATKKKPKKSDGKQIGLGLDDE